MSVFCLTLWLKSKPQWSFWRPRWIWLSYVFSCLLHSSNSEQTRAALAVRVIPRCWVAFWFLLNLYSFWILCNFVKLNFATLALFHGHMSFFNHLIFFFSLFSPFFLCEHCCVGTFLCAKLQWVIADYICAFLLETVLNMWDTLALKVSVCVYLGWVPICPQVLTWH